MFGRMADAAQVGDRIFVLDVRPPSLRMYDASGTYLATIGREGDGPGEFRYPRGLEVHPENGRLYVTDANSARVNVYSPQGDVLDRYRIQPFPGTPYEVVDRHGTIFIHEPMQGPDIEPYSVFKMIGYGPDGETGFEDEKSVGIHTRIPYPAATGCSRLTNVIVGSC